MSTWMGTGNDFDVSLTPEANLKTTTTQYKVVGFTPNTSGAADFTVGLADNTGTAGTPTACAYHALGVNQTYMSANSSKCSVRLFGISKVVCAASVTAGNFIVAYSGISTTTMAGKVVPVKTGETSTAYGMSVSSFQVVLGRALQGGTTNTVITAFINPQLYDANFLATST